MNSPHPAPARIPPLKEGINHYRFHTWCPPEAAHAAADIVGIYMQPELPNWNSLGELPKGIDGDVELRGEATQGTRHADYLRAEGRRILEAYGNHASFVMFALGNELGGSRETMAALVAGFRRFDPRPLYAQGFNNYIGAPTLAPGDDYWTTTFTGGHYSAGNLTRMPRGVERSDIKASCFHDIHRI